jgi:hypothetical protein
MRSASGEAGSGPVVRRGRLLFLFAALGAASSWGGAAPAAHDGVGTAVAPSAYRFTADAAARPASARRLAEEDWTGGRFSLPGGEAVTVYVSYAYSGDPGAGRRWADYLGGLLHGSELNVLEAYIAPPAEVLELCFAKALGCYGNDTLISIGETVGGVAAEEVVAHEYGHHVAHNRANPPWRAIDYGTKRWATHARICARAAAAEIFPGDEGLHYQLNPGEAFAETYRALVESKRGAGTFAWSLVDRSFYPDAEALARVAEDVVRPWVRPKLSARSGRIRAGARSWTVSVATPLDGDLDVYLKLRVAAGVRLQILEGDSARVAARGLWASTTEQRARLPVCGSRTARIRISGSAGTRFALNLSVP